MANSPQGKGRLGQASSYSDADPTHVDGGDRARQVDLPSVGGTFDTSMTAAGRPAAMGRGKTPEGEDSTRVSVIEDMPQSTGDEALDRLGSTLGSYKLKRIIGRGGMGCVYEAIHTKLGRPVALKLLHSDYARRRDAVARFFQEARAVNQIRHRNIVDITDLLELEDGTTFIIMELLDGNSLSHLMKQGRQEKSRMLGILVQICDALAAAHAEGIIHRDLKPDNIVIVRSDEDQDIVKLLDFGVAKLLHVDHEEGLTAAGAVVGTPAFMSPEQAAGLTIDRRADIYSLGAIMYELFCEEPLFRGASFGEYVRMHLDEAPRPPSETNGADQIDKPLSAIILKCLAKSPDKRFQNATQLRSELFSLLTVEDAKVLAEEASEDASETVRDTTQLMATPITGAETASNHISDDDETLIAPQSRNEASRPIPSMANPSPASYGLETAMALGDVPRQSRQALVARNKWVWVGGIAAAASIAIIAAVAVVGANSEQPIASGGEGDATQATPNVDPIDEASASVVPSVPNRAVIVSSTPSGLVYRVGEDKLICKTPCAVPIEPSDDPSATISFVIKHVGFEPAEFAVNRKDPVPQVDRILKSEFASAFPDAGPTEDVAPDGAPHIEAIPDPLPTDPKPTDPKPTTGPSTTPVKTNTQKTTPVKTNTQKTTPVKTNTEKTTPVKTNTQKTNTQKTGTQKTTTQKTNTQKTGTQKNGKKPTKDALFNPFK